MINIHSIGNPQIITVRLLSGRGYLGKCRYTCSPGRQLSDRWNQPNRKLTREYNKILMLIGITLWWVTFSLAAFFDSVSIQVFSLSMTLNSCWMFLIMSESWSHISLFNIRVIVRSKQSNSNKNLRPLWKTRQNFGSRTFGPRHTACDRWRR